MAKVVTQQDFKTLPWKNGGGTTRELYRLPHPHDSEKFLLRLSMANVFQDGPFSHFEGTDRILMLIDGAGLNLQFPDDVNISLINTLEPIHFPGEDAVIATLVNGPVEDFNVMIDRTWGQAQARISQAQHFVAKDLCLVFELAEENLIILEKNETWERPTSTTVIVVDVMLLGDFLHG